MRPTLFLLLVSALAACTIPTEPHYLTHCEQKTMPILGARGDTTFVAVPGDSVCTWLDPVTGQGGAGRHP